MELSAALPFDLLSLATSFFENVTNGTVEIYNEFSFQHELGIWLRLMLPPAYKVQFERNVRFFGLSGENFIKKEIDIVIYDPQKKEKHAIELKYPRNGQYPEQMYSFCKDIHFLEQLCSAGFATCQFIVVADDPLFYQGDASKPIYQFFRGKRPISVVIEKPTGEHREQIALAGVYKVRWEPINGPIKYALLEIGK